MSKKVHVNLIQHIINKILPHLAYQLEKFSGPIMKPRKFYTKTNLLRNKKLIETLNTTSKNIGVLGKEEAKLLWTN